MGSEMCIRDRNSPIAKDEIIISTNFDFEILDSWPLAPNFLLPAKSKIIIAQAETVVAIGAAIHP